MEIDHSRLDVLRTGRGPVAEHVIDEFAAGRLSRREFIRRGTMVGLSVPLLGGILAACGTSTTSSPGSAAKGAAGATIKVGIGVPTAAINPITIADQGGLEMIGQVGEWLVFSDQHNNYHPWLATSWSPNADASVWTFKIRQGVKFNDGTPMTVDDVVYSFKTQSDPKGSSNALSVFGGTLAPDGVVKVDDNTIAFHLQQPDGNFHVIALRSSSHREMSLRNDIHPLNNKYVRQAIAYTLDRPGTVDALFKGYAVVGNDSPFAPSFRATDTSVSQRAKNLTLAKELLAKGGVPRGFSVPLLTEDAEEIPHLAQIVKQAAAQIGVTINLTIESQTKYYGQAVFGKSDWLDGEMSIVDYGARAVPNLFLQAPLQSINAKTGQGSWNAARFNNPTYDNLSKQFIAAVDLSTQRRLAGQIERLLLDETPIIYPYFYDYLSATQKTVAGTYPTAIGQLFLWNATKTA